MYPSPFCRWALRRIGCLQFAQLILLFNSLILCNQFIMRSLSLLVFPNMMGPSTSRKKLGISGAFFFNLNTNVSERITAKSSRIDFWICHTWYHSKLLRCRSLVKPLISFSPLIAVFESYHVGILLVRQPPEIWTGQNNLFHLKHGQGYRSFLIGGDMKEK